MGQIVGRELASAHGHAVQYVAAALHLFADEPGVGAGRVNRVRLSKLAFELLGRDGDGGERRR